MTSGFHIFHNTREVSTQRMHSEAVGCTRSLLQYSWAKHTKQDEKYGSVSLQTQHSQGRTQNLITLGQHKHLSAHLARALKSSNDWKSAQVHTNPKSVYTQLVKVCLTFCNLCVADNALICAAPCTQQVFFSRLLLVDARVPVRV